MRAKDVRVRCVHDTRRPGACSSTQRHQAARGGTPQAGGREPESTGAEAQGEGQAFRFGPRGKVLIERGRFRPLAGDLIPCEALADDLTYRQVKSLTVVHVFPGVEPKRLFVHVSEKMERLNADVGSTNRPLEQTPEVLKAVRVDVATNILNGMVDGPVVEVSLQAVVGKQEVSIDGAPWFDVLPNLRLKRVLLAIGNYSSTNLSAALQYAHDGGLVFVAGSGNPARLHMLVHIARLAADERFVNLNFAGELSAAVAVLQRKANPLEHEPCGFLADAGGATNLVATDAVLTIRNHPHRKQPLIERDRGVFKDGADLDGELSLRVTGLALPHAARRNKGNIGTPAGRTYNTIRPTPRRKVVQTVVGIGKVKDRFLEGAGFAGHESIMGVEG